MSTKVKLKLVQPAIMCSGREETTCYYRGKIMDEGEDKIGKYKLIQFVVHGMIQQQKYYDDKGFIWPQFEDIKIVEK